MTTFLFVTASQTVLWTLTTGTISQRVRNGSVQWWSLSSPKMVTNVVISNHSASKQRACSYLVTLSYSGHKILDEMVQVYKSVLVIISGKDRLRNHAICSQFETKCCKIPKKVCFIYLTTMMTDIALSSHEQSSRVYSMLMYNIAVV